MALITCPECRKEISDQAEACPHCGYPLRKKIEARKIGNKIEKTSNAIAKFGWNLFMLGFLVIILVISTPIIITILAALFGSDSSK